MPESFIAPVLATAALVVIAVAWAELTAERIRSRFSSGSVQATPTPEVPALPTRRAA